MQDIRQNIESYLPFLEYLIKNHKNIKETSFADVIAAAGGSDKIAVISVDIIKGFCSQGPMSSERVGAITKPSVKLISRAYELGVRSFIFPCDCHDKDSLEFRAFPEHALKGTKEAELEDALLALPFSNTFKIVEKPAVNSFQETELSSILKKSDFNTLIVQGDVTDLCLYQLVTGLACLGNALGKAWRIIVPLECAETYDTPIELAEKLGIPAHDAGFINLVFTYHMQLFGAEMVTRII